MAKLDLDNNTAGYQIRSFRPGTIQINERFFHQSIIVLPDELIENWSPQTIAELTAIHLRSLIALQPDVVLIGTGETHVFISSSLYGELINAGIGVEVMSTSAACRTYNALSAENRRVAAALMIS
jgi:uncharacterized protein